MSHDQSGEVVDTKQLTTFHENATVVNNDVREVMPFTETLVQLVDNNDVTDFLGRPTLIASGTWATSDIQKTLLTSGQIRTYLSSIPMWFNKIKGYRLIRAKAHLKLVVNGNPFQQGRLILHCLPLEHTYTAYNNNYVNMHNVTLCNITQQPSVELDIQETSAELIVPFVAPTMFYDRETDEYGWGKFYLTVLSPLATGSGGPTDVEYSLFLSFTEVQLSGPVFVAESSMSKSANARLVKERKTITRSGEVSSLLDKVSTASGIFDDVPVIGEVCKTVSSFAGKFADVFSIFGWSKPTSDKVQEIMTFNPARTMANCDGSNTGDVFALNHSGSLPILGGFAGTNIDEMSFSYLKAIPAYIGTYTWSSSNVTGTTIYTKKIGPGNLRETVLVSTGGQDYSYASAPPAFWLAKMFKYWRGGVKLTFKLIKTPYHSGRLIVNFNCNDGAPTNTQGSYILREIVDIRETNEFTLTLPYIRASNYIYTDLDDDFGSQYNTIGELSVKVLNELRAPETAAQQLRVLVYACAADDYELAYPINYKQMTFIPESGVNGDMKMVPKAIGNASLERSDIVNNNMTLGDAFTSIKQLTNSSRRITLESSGPTTAPFNFAVYPFALNAPKASTFSSSVKIWGDYLAELASGYVLQRGGVRWTIPGGLPNILSTSFVRAASGGDPTYVSQYTNSFTSMFTTPLSAYNANGVCQIEFRKNEIAGVDACIPHFATTPSKLNYYGEAIPDSSDVNQCLLYFDFRTQDGTFTGSEFYPQYGVYRSGMDDFCLGYFIGFAPYLRYREATPP